MDWSMESDWIVAWSAEGESGSWQHHVERNADFQIERVRYTETYVYIR